MKNKIIKKATAILMLIITLVSAFFNNTSIASTEISGANLKLRGRAGNHLKLANGAIISAAYVEYDENGKSYPAYCLNRELPGIGTGEDEYSEYYVDIDTTVDQALDDIRVWRAVINGYPYKTPAELSVEDKFDAFLATKQAVYCILNDFDPYTRYIPTDSRGINIKNAIISIYEAAQGSQMPYTGGVSIETVNNLQDDGDYYSQTFHVNCGVDISQYTITNCSGLPTDAVITSLDNIQKSTFNGSENFKLKIPKIEMNKDINVGISLQAKAKTYPVFYGRTRIAGTQNYAIAYDPFGDLTTYTNFSLTTNTGKLKVYKNDEETKAPISGVTFQLTKTDGTVVQNATTDQNGEATFSNLFQDLYILKEITPNDNYIIDTTGFEVSVLYNNTTTKTVTNEHKKGDLTIYKVDKDNHRIGLGNVEFDLYSEEFQKVIGTYTTDENGKIEVKNLRTGNYKLIEKKTNKWYNLADDTEIEVKWDEETTKNIENELKKGQVKVIKVDTENNEIRLPGVEFEVLDENNNVLEKIITNENGEAFTRRYPIRDFQKLKIRETKTLKNYKLSEEMKTVTLTEDEITDTIFQNEKKKGQVKVIKVDLDNNEIRIPDVEFKVYDESGKIVDTMVTNANGEATSKKLPIDQEYKVQETKTGKWYVLNDKPENVVLKQDEITNMIFTNEKKKGQIKVIKIDKDNNEIKLQGVEFKVYDEDGKLVDTLITDSNGEATTKRLPIDKQYRVQETKTLENYLLNDEIQTVELKENQISNLTFENEKIKGYIKVIKTSEDDNEINEKPAGTPIKDVVFEIFDKDNKKVDEIKTGEDGLAMSKELEKGVYTIREKKSGKWYLINSQDFSVEIVYDQEIVPVEITNESEKPDVDIEKTGLIQTTANQEIRYDFKIKNTGNVPLDHFTWYDYLPTDYVRMTKLITGTYNQDLNYAIYYKTNKNDYRLLKDNLNTQVNNYIDFSKIQLENDEVITEFKADFGTVDVGFKSVINPYIFVKVNNTVENEDIFTNKTRIEGDNKGYLVWDEDEHTTEVYEKEIKIKLPYTGK